MKVTGYNQSDSDGGWFHFLTGMTAYISDPVEHTLDPTYSVNVSSIDYFCSMTFDNILNLRWFRTKFLF